MQKDRRFGSSGSLRSKNKFNRKSKTGAWKGWQSLAKAENFKFVNLEAEKPRAEEKSMR